MSRLSRWTAALLAACILMNSIPVTAFAQTGQTASSESVLAQSDETLPAEEETQISEEETDSAEAEEPLPAEEEILPAEEEALPAEEQAQPEEETLTEEGVQPEEETFTEEGAQPEETEAPQVSLSEENGLTDPSALYFAQILRENGKSPDGILTQTGNEIKLTIRNDQADVLELLSKTSQGLVPQGEEDPFTFDYSKWIINFPDTTGKLALDDFLGLGDEGYPFAGKLTGQPFTLSTQNTLFKALDVNADLGNIKIEWTGTADKAILAEKLYVDVEDHSISMSLTSATAFSPYIGVLKRKDGFEGQSVGVTLLSSLNYTPGTKEGDGENQYNENAGLLCGSMEADTKLIFAGTLTLPGIPVSITSSGDAGTLVGKMDSGAQLTISQDSLALNSTLKAGSNAGGLVGSMADNAVLHVSGTLTTTTTASASQNAGGLVGTMAAGSGIELGADITVTSTLTASESAGGIAGVVTTETGPITFADNKTDKTITLTADSTITGGTNAGGMYGSCDASGNLDPFAGVTIADQTITVGGDGSCGGLFGTLTLNGEGNKCTLENEVLYARLSSVGTSTRFGGIVGTLSGSRENALVVKNTTEITDSTDPHITTNTKYGDNVLKPQYLGGIVAYQKATLEVTNICVKLEDASQTAGETYYTGGVSAYVCDGMLLIADNMRIIFNGYTNDDHNGGVAGYTGKGSIVYLKKQLLLRDCPLQSVQGCGQIVATQDCSLIYGPGVTITRWGQGMEVDDVGSYGELYRVSGLLDIGEDYSTAFMRTLYAQEGIYTLTDALDYACLALAWQSRGAFDTVTGITTDNWSNLQQCSIKLGDNLDLTGTGIGGLSRDVYSEYDVFRGTFDGNGKTLKLDIGAANAQANTSSGDGRIYFHNSTGLFAGLSSNATVKNLMLAGSIRLSNNRLPVNESDQRANMKTGALAGLLLCEGGGSNITGVSTTVSITANSNTVTPNAPFYIGGLFGLAYGSGSTTLTLDGNLGATIFHAISESSTVPIIGQCFHTGGAIGAVDASCTQLNIECNGAVISGKIERTGDTAENFYAGGLIGTIFPSESSSRTITLTNLKVGQSAAENIAAKPFELKGSAGKRMGGVLGGIWADTDVTVSGLTVENVTLTASSTAKLGGLVYRASGKWEVSSADLSGLTITAGNAEALGLMVCQGGPYREPLEYNKNAASGTVTYKEIGGLYLVMTENWSTAYQVPTNGKITVKGDCVFDELVAYTANAYYTAGNKDTPPYSITSNGSGIISLKTSNNTVNMTGEESDQNTYENRTDVAKKSNPYSRYYYNLPEVKKACSTEEQNRIDTPQELLIWSVYRYAASNLKKYFRIDGVDTANIGGTPDAARANFNMTGLSYYPIRITNSDITVRYADVTFYNNEIENRVSEEKSTRGNTQHYTMHCGLFLDFAAENITTSGNYTMTVNGVNFAGTVGKVNGQSGALICGSVYGDKENSNTATCTVVLADADDSDKAVILNGISVDPISVDPDDEDYRPVLIGHMDSYSGLKANYITTSNEQKKAGSSLVGTVGSGNAVGIAIAFAGTIKLPDTENAVFTKATLLQSLQYQSGSTATYRFNKDKDWQEDGTHVKNITYGFEISESVEFPDDKGCYYDGFGEGYYVSDTRDFSKRNDFTGYLPYVAYSPAKGADQDRGWHELEVNILAPDLDDGCGTYGHPYHVNAKDLRYVAIYLSKPSEAPKNWKIMFPSQDDYHTTGGDIELTFDGTQWTGGDKTYKLEAIQKHLNSAYYVIDNDMTLRNFSGLGTAERPFTGVITGGTETGKPTVTLSGTTPAFVYYSNGCVVRNLNIVLEQKLSLRFSAPGVDGSYNRKADAAPDHFFGGVIGLVMGGDNIIDDVSVSAQQGFSLSFTENYKGFAHLVPIGGYVGAIAGGGVIFRGTCSGGIINDDTDKGSKFLYRNPIVGRVLGGYAFYEGNGTAPDNTDKNYKINTITPGEHLSLSGDTLTIKDAEGLLLLSAIVSSGAGSYGNSLAYKDGYGVARAAKYNQIGASSEPDDYTLANNNANKKDIPYLVYREGIEIKICPEDPQNLGQTGITVKLDADLDMSSYGSNYGSGYRGLSARYVCNAGFTANANGTTQLSPYTVVMRIKSFDGNNKTVSGINMDVREYDDDDFHAASVGGIFNIVWTNKDTGGGSSNSNNSTSGYDSVLAKNLTLQNCTVKLQYIDQNGADVRQAQPAYFTQTDGISTVAVGGFIGTVNNLSNTGMNSTKSNYLFTSICVTATGTGRSTIYGPNSAGAIIGATGMGSTGYPGKLLTDAKTVRFGPSFLNCSYSNTDVTGYLAAGGMVGCAAVYGKDFQSFGENQATGSEGCYATCTITEENLTFAKNSTVKTQAAGGICGGVFGGIGMRGLINDPAVNSRTGLTIIGTNQSVQTLQFDDVDILADVVFDDYIYTATGTKNGVDKGATIAAAGCIGRICNQNDVSIYQVQFGSNTPENNGCTIQAKKTSASTKITVGAQYAGGLVAYGYTMKEIKIQDCAVYCTDITGPTAGGLIALSGVATLNISNCTIEDCTVDSSTRAGGLAGYFNYTNCTANLFNILIKNTSVTKDKVAANVTTIGRLFGEKSSSYQVTLSAAGISVFAKDSTIRLPDNDMAGTYTGYVAYADYLADQTEQPGSKDPYVTVNPSYSLTMADSPTELLTGDAVKASESYGSIAKGIWTENSASAPESKSNYASYPAARAIAEPTVSNFNKELGEGPTDLPVLVVKGGDSKAITDYLDIITNGGYTEASNSKVDKVTFTATPYYLNKDKTAFSTDENWDTEHTGDPSVTTTDDGKKLVVSGTSYDNTRHRFTLVQATFQTDLGNYTVSIPVVVLRKLEYVYMTTFSYGTEFYAETYQDITTHLLESTGVPFTAYLTFRYNQAYNANAATKLEYAEYDWKSYIEGGGNLIGMDKTLEFSVPFPKGTQLTLVDCQHGNQAYYYTINSDQGEQKILLSSFRKNDNDTTGFAFSMADVLGVTRSKEPVETGAFTKLEKTDEATILVNGDYFRPAKEGDEAGNRYDLIFPDDLSRSVPEENYYLVITVPTQYIAKDQVDTTFSLNGALTISLTDYLIPTNGTQVHRYGDNSKSTNYSDETTYQISSGYQQSLSAINTNPPTVDLNDANNAMQMTLRDTITFSNSQAYSSADPLFLKFTASLKQKEKDEVGNVSESDSGFPAGTSGTVKFYIQDTDGYYYVPSENGWTKQSDKPDGTGSGYPAYPWVCDGGNLSLPLSSDGTTPIDLSGVRDRIKGNEGTSEIIVTAEMEKVKVPPGGEDDPIPSSENGIDTWAQIHYLAQISTQARSLNYSTVRAMTDDTVHYYRRAENKVILSMDAVKIGQLGVNPLAPVEEDLVDGRSRIELNAVLNLTEVKNREELLQQTEQVVFSLSLERRNDSVYGTVEDEESFISFRWPKDTPGWSFTVSKNDLQFQEGLYTIPLTAYVAMDQTTYANYQIKMDVQFLDGEGNAVLSPVQKDTSDANVVYTYACIKPSFYDPSAVPSSAA